MKFFIDTANIDEIEQARSWGILDGVTTNPSLYAKAGGRLADFEPHMQRICELCAGLPVSVETCAKTTDGMIADARRLHSLADNVVVKLPICAEALAATNALAEEGIPVNMTLVFSAPQALLAARAGARYVSPFVGRFDDVGEDGIERLAETIQALRNYDFGHEVEVIVASVRSANHVTQAALLGADIATVPLKTLRQCLAHPLTEQGVAKFDADWEKVKNA